jgi:hypothetical protein
MAFTITQAARDWASQDNIKPNIVLNLKKIGKVFGATIVGQTVSFGDSIFYGDEDLAYGGFSALDNQFDYVSLNGTSDTITQQLEIDKAEATSTSSLTIRLIDPNNEISEMVSYSVTGIEVLETDAIVSIGGSDTTYPTDYIEILTGKITAIVPGAGFIDFTVTHPEDLKRGEVFTKAEAVLVAPAKFNSEDIQGLFFQARADVVGTVQVLFTTGASGDTANIIVIGNLIQVQIDTVATRIRTIKKKIENDEDANQLVSLKITGDPDAIAALQPLTSLTTDTELELDTVQFFLDPTVDTKFKTYVRIGEEIIGYTSRDLVNNKLLGCTRGALTSLAFDHEIDDSVSSFYVLGDGTSSSNAIDMSLWVLLSGGPTLFAENLDVENFVQVGGMVSIPNAVYFTTDYYKEFNFVPGDLVTCTGAVNPANNFVDRKIASVGSDSEGFYFTVEGAPLALETSSPAVFSIKSAYNVLPDGAGLLPNQVDIAQFLLTKQLYGASMGNYSIYLKDTIQAKDLINTDIFLPSALRSIPRKGKVSLAFSAPPIYSTETQTLDLTTVKDPKNLRLARSTAKDFYNSIVWRFNEDSVEDKLLSGEVVLSADSTNRIDARNKPLKIEARGLRPGFVTSQLIQRNTTRLLQRFQFAAESLKVDVPFKVGWTTEVGDPIILDGDGLNLTDISRGDRDFQPRIFEITNKSLNWKTGAVTLNITDTAFYQEARFGVWSPSSNTDTGSVSNQLRIKNSYGLSFPRVERDKWTAYIGQQLLIHSQDFSVEYQATLLSFDVVDPYLMNITDIGVAVPADYVIELDRYNELVDPTFVKAAHLWWDPSVEVVTGVSQTAFNVSLLDAAKFFVGSPIRVHNQDFSNDSELEVIKVVSVVGTLVTVDKAIGFVPAANDRVELIGFAIDNGKPYAWL